MIIEIIAWTPPSPLSCVTKLPLLISHLLTFSGKAFSCKLREIPILKMAQRTHHHLDIICQEDLPYIFPSSERMIFLRPHGG